MNILNEGGNAIKQSMPIPAEISQSLAENIANKLGNALKIKTAVYGSVGKKNPGQTHGDLDIGVEMPYNSENLEKLKNTIDELFGEHVVESKDSPGLKLYSFGYCYDYKGETKIAQVDCMFTSSVEIGSFSYYSPNFAKNESKFKGMYRTELLDTIISKHPIDTNDYPEDFWEDEFDGKYRGQVKRYWKYSFDRDLGVVIKHKTYESPAAKPKGPVKTSRTIKEDTIVFLNNPEKIVKWALGSDATIKDVNSFESIVNYIVSHWDSERVNEILDSFFKKQQFARLEDGSVEQAEEYVKNAYNNLNESLANNLLIRQYKSVELNESFEFDDADEDDGEELLKFEKEFMKYHYFPETKEELREILKKLIKERGPKGDFNDIYTGFITDMSYLFDGHRHDIFCKFNGDISNWNVSKVENMNGMFFKCYKFNKDISGWDVRNVENMENMFKFCEKFNQNISGWDVRNVETMEEMFYYCTNFNQDISGWDVSNVENMEGMFWDCEKFKKDLSRWNVDASKTNIQYMFSGCSSCPIPSWYKTQIYESFEFDDADEEDDEESFNRDMSALQEFARYNYYPETKEELQELLIKLIEERDPEGDFNDIYTGDITDMSYLFSVGENLFFTEFNGDISKWNVSKVENMRCMFSGCKSFNQNIGGWDVRKVENMRYMFDGCKNFNQNIGRWNVSNVKDMGFMFWGCENFNQDISRWNVSRVKNMVQMFNGCKKFNQDLSCWNIDTRKTDTRYMFKRCNSNCPIPSWYKTQIYESFEFDDADEEDDEESFNRDTRALREFAQYNYFPKTKKELREIIIKLIKKRGFKGDFNDIYTGFIYDMSGLFDVAKCDKFKLFNGDISNWNVSKVENMRCMFCGCKSFNQDISGWDVSKVEDMSYMFSNCENFNQDISDWDVSNVENMEGMFSMCTRFNQNIGGWDVSNVKYMGVMFYVCKVFNQDISGWDVSNVKDMKFMFAYCENFIQKLDGWRIGTQTELSSMFYATVLRKPQWYFGRA